MTENQAVHGVAPSHAYRAMAGYILSRQADGVGDAAGALRWASLISFSFWLLVSGFWLLYNQKPETNEPETVV